MSTDPNKPTTPPAPPTVGDTPPAAPTAPPQQPPTDTPPASAADQAAAAAENAPLKEGGDEKTDDTRSPQQKAADTRKANAAKKAQAPSNDMLRKLLGKSKSLRPSMLAEEKLRAALGLKPGDEAPSHLTSGTGSKIDRAKFLREHGLPNPLCKFRVSAGRGETQHEPREFDAVDESDARRQMINALGIRREAHSHTFSIVVVER